MCKKQRCIETANDILHSWQVKGKTSSIQEVNKLSDKLPRY